MTIGLDLMSLINTQYVCYDCVHDHQHHRHRLHLTAMS